jgi:energy-coupling factor transport system ATP-binding protein
MSSGPLIRFEGVSFSYPTEPRRSGERRAVAALKGIDLEVWPGEYIVVLGRNGSGKSTLARHCNALLLPTRGRVLVDGLDTLDPIARRPIRDRVGVIFQNPDNQIISTVVEDDVAWGLAARRWPVGEIRARVTEAMNAVGIADLREHSPHRLSGGQRQRVAIASALALRPSCLVADEPTALLNPVGRVEVAALLRRLNRELGLTIVHVTHLLEEAAEADRVVVMDEGTIAREGPPAAVFADLGWLRRLGLAIPEPIVLAERLRASGWTLAPTALTLEAIAEQIAR